MCIQSIRFTVGIPQFILHLKHFFKGANNPTSIILLAAHSTLPPYEIHYENHSHLNEAIIWLICISIWMVSIVCQTKQYGWHLFLMDGVNGVSYRWYHASRGVAAKMTKLTFLAYCCGNTVIYVLWRSLDWKFKNVFKWLILISLCAEMRKNKWQKRCIYWHHWVYAPKWGKCDTLTAYHTINTSWRRDNNTLQNIQKTSNHSPEKYHFGGYALLAWYHRCNSPLRYIRREFELCSMPRHGALFYIHIKMLI